MTVTSKKPPASPADDAEKAGTFTIAPPAGETPSVATAQAPPALASAGTAASTTTTATTDAKGGSYAPEPAAQDNHAVADPLKVPETETVASESGTAPDDEAPQKDAAQGTVTLTPRTDAAEATDGIAAPAEPAASTETSATTTVPPAQNGAQPNQNQAQQGTQTGQPTQDVPPQPTEAEVRAEVEKREREMRWQRTRNAIGTALAVAPGIAGQGIATAMGTVTRLMDAFFSGGPMALGSRIFAEALADADTASRLAKEAHAAYGIAEDADREALKGTYQGRMLEARGRAARTGIARAHLWMSGQNVEEMDHAGLDRLDDAMRRRRAELAQQAQRAPRDKRREIAAEIGALDDVAKGIRSRRSALRTEDREQRDRDARERTARYDEAYNAITDPEDIRRIAMDARGRRDIDWTDAGAGPVPADPAEGRRVAAALQDRAAVLREQGDTAGSERLTREAERIAMASETPAARTAREEREARDAQRASDRAQREQERERKKQEREAAEQAEKDRRDAMPGWQVAWEDESRRVGRGTPSWGADGLPTADLPSYSAYALRQANALPDGDPRRAEWLDRADAADLRRVLNSIDRNGDIARSDVNADRAAILIDRHLEAAGITPDMLAMKDGGTSLAQKLQGADRDTRALVRNRLIRDARDGINGLGTDPAVKEWLTEAMKDGSPQAFVRLRTRAEALRTGRKVAPAMQRYSRGLKGLLDRNAQHSGHALGTGQAARLGRILTAIEGFDPADAAGKDMTSGEMNDALKNAGSLIDDANKAMGDYMSGIKALKEARRNGDVVKEKEAKDGIKAAYATLRGFERPDPIEGRSRLDVVEASLGLPTRITASASPDRATALRIAGRAVLASRLGVPVDPRLVKSAQALLKSR